MNNIKSIGTKCTGCNACATICPVKAITMVRDAEGGFIYPNVNIALCSKCGLCLQYCPINNLAENNNCIRSWYGRAKDSVIVKRSSSGGMFRLLADSVIQRGGIVYGAIFNPETKRIEHKSSDDVDLDSLMRSKYSESYIGNIFESVKKELEGGRFVLFCGTPCEVAGLRRYIKTNNSKKLLIVDFICGGAASPECFKQHLEHLENKYKSEVLSVNFRDKTYGWKRFSLDVRFKNGKRYLRLNYFDSYFSGFVNGYIKRICCYSCPYSDNHYSDITLADFWNHKNVGVKLDNKGCSVVSAHTQKGIEAINLILESAHLTEIEYESIKNNYHKRTVSVDKINYRKQVFQLISNYGFEAASKNTYMKHPLRDIILSKIGRG